MLVIESRQLPVLLKQNLTYECLVRGDDQTSNAIIDAFCDNDMFMIASKKATAEIMERDREDGEKLAVGIKLSVDQGVLPPLEPAPYTKIGVMGKTADEVASEILTAVGDGVKKGCVIVLVGKSGTGKGTTVRKIKAQIDNVVTWSNGNVFRSLTKLMAAHCVKVNPECQDENGKVNKEFLESECKKEGLLSEMMKCLSFGEYEGQLDTRIFNEGFGIDMLVSKVCNTELKTPDVAKNIPTVAGFSQGHVVGFASGAVKQISESGKTVLLEGREETVDYIESSYRFELVLQDPNIIGMRRTAQRIVGQVVGLLDKSDNPDYNAVYDALSKELKVLSEA